MKRPLLAMSGAASLALGLLLGSLGACTDVGTCPPAGDLPTGTYEISEAEYFVFDGTFTIAEEEAVIEYRDDEGALWRVRYELVESGY